MINDIMTKFSTMSHNRYSIIYLILLILSGCSHLIQTTPAYTSEPTPTEPPMAARVNGEGITLAEYESELSRYQAYESEQGISSELTAQREKVLDELITQVLLAQAGSLQGYMIEDSVLDQKLSDLINQTGGQEKYQEWLSKNAFDEESFKHALRRSLVAAWMRDQIAASVADTADQVHVRQIRVSTIEEAQQVQQQLQGGTDFNLLAAQYDPLTNGELGWFPRGYLLQPTVDEAAFNLQPGQVSEMIQSEVGYHFLLLVERDAQHMLSPDAKLFLQRQAVIQWLQQRRAESTIEILLP